MGFLKKKRVWELLLLNLPGVAGILVALITYPVILKHIPKEDYGRWQFAMALQGWILTFSAGQIILGAKRGVAVGLKGTMLYAFLYRLKLLLILGSAMVLAGLIMWIARWHPKLGILIVFAGLYLMEGFLAQVSFSEFLIATKQFGKRAAGIIMAFTVSNGGSAVAAYLTGNVFAYTGFLLASNFLIYNILWWLLVFKQGVMESYKKGEIDRNCVKFGLTMIPFDLIAATANKLSHFAIGAFSGFADLAVFSVANRLRDQMANVLKSLRGLFYADFAKEDSTLLLKRLFEQKILLKGGILGLFAGIAGTLFTWGYVKFFLPPSFSFAVLYFLILATAFPAAVMTIVLQTVFESQLQARKLTIIGVSTNVPRIFLIVLLGYLWGIKGVCVAMSLSLWAGFFLYLFFGIKDLSKG